MHKGQPGVSQPVGGWAALGSWEKWGALGLRQCTQSPCERPPVPAWSSSSGLTGGCVPALLSRGFL